MQVFKNFLNKISGWHYTQEYLCLNKETFQSSLFIYCVKENIITEDLTEKHLFVGYAPLLIALLNEESQYVQLYFSINPLILNTNVSNQRPVASMILNRVGELLHDGKLFSIYIGEKGEHSFQKPLQQLASSLQNYLYNRKKGNVYLHGDLYKQVQIAYSIPRQISLISVAQNGLYNLFPTDLHGTIHPHYYLISLRNSGKACKQVMESKKIVLSNVDASMYREVYALGKNHMQPLKSEENFIFNGKVSHQYHFPLPKMTTSYYELSIVNSIQFGIHRVMLFKIDYHSNTNKASSLAHIHNSYASWRKKKGLESNYLFR